jgi:hypothetical protein
MRRLTFEPARPIDTDGTPWIPTEPVKSFRPLRFAADGWSELMSPALTVAPPRPAGWAGPRSCVVTAGRGVALSVLRDRG